MTRTSFGEVSEDSIISGLWLLLDHGSYLVAVVVFTASIAVPITKFVVVATLALSIQRRWRLSRLKRQKAYEIIEAIGRWSMIDVFVVTVLAGLVQLEVLATVEPGMGATFFGLSVICTMVAALSFDSRLMWDWDDAVGARP